LVVVIVVGNPHSLKVQETAHEIARSVKSSSEYSLEEKEEILSNLKAINKDAKEYADAHGHKKSQLKKDLHAKMAALKTEMHDNKALERERALEEEETRAKEKVSNVHNDLKGVKDELKAAHLKGTQKKQAKALYKKLEQEYSELAAQTTKTGRQAIARTMKTTAAELKKFIVPKETLESKKEKIMSLVRSAEEEYAGKTLRSSAKQQIHSAFEEMKSELNAESDPHTLKTMLKEKVEAIRQMESQGKNDDDDDFEEEDEDEKVVEHKDFEEEDSDDLSNKAIELEESVSGDEE
jgi:hypothetical protein